MIWCLPLFGGVLIGIAASLMLILNGRVTGISGIASGALLNPRGEIAWRWAFLLGLLSGGVILQTFSPSSLASQISFSEVHLVIAGLLVGFGSTMGGGCTSGHGVCGIARLSLRSIFATIIFISFGMLSTYWMIHHFGAHP